jgi:hypothetical protein
MRTLPFFPEPLEPLKRLLRLLMDCIYTEVPRMFALGPFPLGSSYIICWHAPCSD